MPRSSTTVTMWMDADADGTIDEQQFADDFDSNQVTLTYDDNGKLTYDGVFTYVYDGWNRLVEVQRKSGGDTTTVAGYAYFADNRRSEKIVQNSGAEVVENDGGDTTVRFYYCGTGFQPVSRWNVCETRALRRVPPKVRNQAVREQPLRPRLPRLAPRARMGPAGLHG